MTLGPMFVSIEFSKTIFYGNHIMDDTCSMIRHNHWANVYLKPSPGGLPNYIVQSIFAFHWSKDDSLQFNVMPQPLRKPNAPHGICYIFATTPSEVANQKDDATQLTYITSIYDKYLLRQVILPISYVD